MYAILYHSVVYYLNSEQYCEFLKPIKKLVHLMINAAHSSTRTRKKATKATYYYQYHLILYHSVVYYLPLEHYYDYLRV